MQHYELLYILPGTLGENEIPAHIELVKKVITDAGGKDVTITAQGKNRLAYPMKHIRYGYFQLGTFQVEPGLMPTIEAKLKLVDGVLRLITRKFEAKKKPTTVIAFAGMMNAPSAAREEALDTERPPEHVATAAPRKEKVVSVTRESAPTVTTETKAEDVNLDDINKKLDQLLEHDLANV